MTLQESLALDIIAQRKSILYLEEKLEKSTAYKRVVEAKELLSSLSALCKCEKEYCTVVHGGDTGNYDPLCDYYVKTITCNICGKRAHYYDHEEMYNNY